MVTGMKLCSVLSGALLVGCATAGSAWMEQPLTGEDDEEWGDVYEEPIDAREPGVARPVGPTRRAPARRPATAPKKKRIEGKVLGKFRNTYYDFPSERDYKGANVALKNARCETIRNVPRGFHDAVCVQGSGTLASGSTVSFAKRDCECAEICPRTKQKICFDELDRKQFPWGRGAAGTAITPLITVAVDTSVIPLGSPVYIPEYDGLPRDENNTSFHDGCFIAQDRGLKIKGKHVDVFTGHEDVTKLWNRLVPSNDGVTVVLENPRCARAQLP